MSVLPASVFPASSACGGAVGGVHTGKPSPEETFEASAVSPAGGTGGAA
jgi:hypothetical protein